MPWTAEPARRAAVVHVAGELEELALAADSAQRGEVPDRPALVVGQQSLDDRTRAPSGRHTLYVYGHVPSRYALPDEVVADRIQAQLERFAPGFSSRVLARTLRPPWQSERENPSHSGPAVHGMSGRGAARALLQDRRLRPWRRP